MLWCGGDEGELGPYSTYVSKTKEGVSIKAILFQNNRMSGKLYGSDPAS